MKVNVAANKKAPDLLSSIFFFSAADLFHLPSCLSVCLCLLISSFVSFSDAFSILGRRRHFAFLYFFPYLLSVQVLLSDNVSMSVCNSVHGLIRGGR